MFAPLVVAATLAVFGTGVMLLVLSAGVWRNLHKAAFIGWFVVTSVHVLAYMWRVPRLAAPDWRRDDRLGGAVHRRLLLGGAVAAGVVLASATVQYAAAWTSAG